jgi:hypothetical protein
MSATWKIEHGPDRDSTRERVAIVFHSDLGLRAEVSIPTDILRNDFPVPDTLEVKKERTEWVLRAMLEQFCATRQSGMNPDKLATIDEKQIDMFLIKRQFLQR